MRRAIVGVLAALLVAPLAPIAGAAPDVAIGSGLRIDKPPGAGDATVVAVIDNAFTPYHWDFLASKMPQHSDRDSSNDLPLDAAPHEWLPGFPSPQRFASYKSLDLTFSDDENAQITPLDALDKPKWDEVKQSTDAQLNYYWIPETKVIGAVDFAGNQIHGASNSHGTGTSSSAVGNLHGTCPECLVVLISYGDALSGEAALNWAMDQPWIDVISNSYGFSLAERDRIYNGGNAEQQRDASERGQTIFFSAGNGIRNIFLIPNSTLMSSQEGPDWTITVGAVSPGADNYYGSSLTPAYHASYTGHGKPADIAGIGGSYPTSYGALSVSQTGAGGFGGTSNATPQIAGTFARALYMARRALPGVSRAQEAGVIARGRGFECARARRDCELGDSRLTAVELRTRLLHGAIHTEPGMTVSSLTLGELPPVGEDEFLNEGHGSYFGRETGRFKAYLQEFERIMGPLEGRSKPLERPAGELEWMIVDSFCRQHLWGTWTGGYYIEGKTDLPGLDPMAPIRSVIETGCPSLQPPP